MKEQWQYRKTPILPQKGYLTSFKKTTNPNLSPIGKRFEPMICKDEAKKIPI